jgi:hypothetical protein
MAARTEIVTKSENDVLAISGRNEAVQSQHSSRPIYDLADLSGLGSPRFVLTVDTEEEFDWTKPFAREGFATTHLTAVPRFQALCDEFDVKPCYLIDYPIAQDHFGIKLLGGYAHDGRAEIGVQLHPWVNPPFDEPLNEINSYACNLPPELERAKLTRLHDDIVAHMGVKPDAYRAGRYGAGPSTPSILQDLGIAIDSSVRARFDYSDQKGPNYQHHPVVPYWLSRGHLLELPLTTVFAGAMRSAGNMVFGEWFGSQAARSVLARSNMLERIALTPEGIPVDKAIEGIDLALDERVPVITLSFHSPSLAVGHTPYVQDEYQLEELYIWFERVFRHLRDRGVRPTTMAEIKTVSRLKHLR